MKEDCVINFDVSYLPSVDVDRIPHKVWPKSQQNPKPSNFTYKCTQKLLFFDFRHIILDYRPLLY